MKKTNTASLIVCCLLSAGLALAAGWARDHLAFPDLSTGNHVVGAVTWYLVFMARLVAPIVTYAGWTLAAVGGALLVYRLRQADRAPARRVG